MKYRYNMIQLLVMIVMAVFLFTCNASARSISLTIEDLFQQVEVDNMEIRIACNEREVAFMRERAEKDCWLPDIGLMLEEDYLGNAYVLDRDLGGGSRSPMTHWGNSLSISVYQPIYTGGELTARVARADAQYRIADNNVELIKIRMKMTVVKLYLELAKNLNLLGVYDENIRITCGLIDEMKARASQGLVLANDVTRYELNLSNLKYDRLAVVNSISNLNYSLVSYLQMNDTDTIVPAIDFDRINFSAMPLPEWRKLSRAESPVLKYYEFQWNLLKSSVKLFKSDRLPKIGIGAAASLSAPITTHTPVLDKNLGKWYVGLKISFTPSAFYKSTHKIQAATLERDHLIDSYKGSEEEIDRNLDRAYRNYIEAIEHVWTQRKNVDLASENYRIVERRYGSDLSLLTDMLDASASKLDAEMRLVNARVDVLYYYFQLKYISGVI